MTTFIHIGAPKTATTYIQAFLDVNRERLEKLGTGVVLPKQIRESTCYKYHVSKHMGFKRNVTLEEAIDNFNKHTSGFPNVIISEEGLTHDLMPSPKTKGAFGGVRAAAESLAELSSGNATIVLSIRRQDSYITSCYKHKIKWQGQGLTYPEYFFNGVDVFGLSWKSVIDEFERCFPGRVKVVPFELIKVDARRYLDYFLKVCGIEAGEGVFDYEVPGHVKNESLTDVETVFLRGVNRELARLTEIDSGKRFELIKMVSTLMIGVDGEKHRIRLPQHWKNRIIELYKEENMGIIDAYCSDIADCVSGYYA